MARRSFTLLAGFAPQATIESRRSSSGFPESETDDSPGKFGSLHANLSYFAFLDGSVHTIEHSLDVATLVMLSAIGDGGDVPDGVFAD